MKLICQECFDDLPLGTHANRRFCNGCRKLKRAEADRARNKLLSRKLQNRARVRRYEQRHRDKCLASRRRAYYNRKIRKVAGEEALWQGVPVETVLQQWGAL
jgi:hypothetical protein